METCQRYADDSQAKAVARFMTMIDAPVLLDITAMPASAECNHHLIIAADRCSSMSAQFAALYKDNPQEERLLRVRLIMEEVGELLHAIARTDEVEMVDAIADILYVVIGTAVTYDLPCDAAFREAHRSNMTKDTHVDHAAGIKGKGTQFSKPDFTAIIATHRQVG